MTNADRIRQMSDEELALLMMCPAEYDQEFNKTQKCTGEMIQNCYICSLKWLKSEVEEHGITMCKKNFYSLMNDNDVIGVKKQDGYQIESDDITLYIYEENFKSKIYFIDPDTGMALYTMYDVGIDDIEFYPVDLIAKALATLEEMKQTKQYAYNVAIFKKYKEARLFYEECQSAIQGIRGKEQRE